MFTSGMVLFFWKNLMIFHARLENLPSSLGSLNLIHTALPDPPLPLSPLSILKICQFWLRFVVLISLCWLLCSFSVLLLLSSHPSPSFLSTMQTGLRAVLPIFCIWVKMAPSPLLNLLRERLIFSRMPLISLYIFAFVCLLVIYCCCKVDYQRYTISGAPSICQCRPCSSFSNLCREVQKSCHVERPESFSSFHNARFDTSLQPCRADIFWAASLQSDHDHSIWRSVAKISSIYGSPLRTGADARPVWARVSADSLRTTRGVFLRYAFMSFCQNFLISVYSCPLDMFGASIPVTPKKNRRAFGGSGVTTSSEWYDSKLPNCVDFDKQGMFLRCPPLINNF